MSKGLQFHERDDYGYLIEDLAKWRGALVRLCLKHLLQLMIGDTEIAKLFSH